MNEKIDKLNRELRFIEESFRTGIISGEEYKNAKERVESKLGLLKSEETSTEKPAQESPSSESPKLYSYADPAEVEKAAKEIIQEKIKQDLIIPKVESEPAANTRQEKLTNLEKSQDETRKLILETYGKPKPKRKIIFWIILIAILIYLIFSFNNNGDIAKVIPTVDPLEEEFIPDCKVDFDCEQTGFSGTCSNPGERNAKCIFVPAVDFEVNLVIDNDCTLCDSSRMKNTLIQIFPGATFKEISYNSVEGSKLISEHNIRSLPAMIIDEEIIKTNKFEDTQGLFLESNGAFLLKPTISGSNYYFKRQSEPKTIDLFIDPFTETSRIAYENLAEFATQVDVNFMIRYYVLLENEEINKQICNRNSNVYLDYMDCFFNEDSCNTLETCSNANFLLDDDLELASQFGINSVPTFVINNQFKQGGSLSSDLLEEIYCEVNVC